MTFLSRRRFLTISAASAACPAIASPDTAARWRGSALGAPASMQLVGLTDVQAHPIFAAIEAEVTRLEDIFSLYRPDSQLSRLNRDGYLAHPAPEMLDLLSLCTVLHENSGGAFDPTIQPLWTALVSGTDTANARKTIGWNKVSVNSDVVRLPYPGHSALTLNGIAQGAITDRIAALLISKGLQDILVDMGEIAAFGQRHDGRDWQVGLAGPESQITKRIFLRDRAVATSDSANLMLTDAHGHILSPTGQTPARRVLSVSANSAALADGLSTTLCALSDKDLPNVLNRFQDARLEMKV
ncbi:FAD:protein FMN transferase [Ruegeria sp. A3M17]|uniref:FAD:protein FMN transferase n=1 Tax=Ruegeria sp. A3M17 TaxID=2267229 RepID=UPI000DEB1217|nr:FAD:protein FMN transferase [Ruegeria sp. A3M17]RBW54760.1 FAD:protein FMN transferase [Ruegeria sp. A3M17]